MTRTTADAANLNQNPDALFFQPLLEKNTWLIRSRWIYPFLFLLYFLVYKPPAGASALPLLPILALFALALAANLLFVLGLRRRLHRVSQPADYSRLQDFTCLQIDFDLTVVFLVLFIPKMMESPLLNLFFFYLILSPFLIPQAKALRNLILSTLLIFVGYLAQSPDFALSGREVATLLTWIVLLFFAFFVATFLSRNLRKNEELMQKLLRHTHELSISDGLTGLFNQTYFFEALENETKISLRHGLSYSLIMLDVDFFKNYNDHNGHLHGSAALRRLGQIMKRVFRTTDVLAKYGGDEFVIILPQTEKIGAYLAAERLREAVEGEPFPGAERQPAGRLTISLGIASFSEHGRASEEIVEGADKALYLAKSLGRNRTVIYHAGIETEEEA